MKTSHILIGLVIILIVGFLFLNLGNDNKSNNLSDNIQSETTDSGTDSATVSEKIDWRTSALTDVRTQQVFTISQFDKPILLESFAVWCPTCTKQQTEIKLLHEELGDSFVSISLDTDPNEDKAKVLDHIQRNQFNWYYAISPRELTESLIDEFGINFVNAPQAPVVLICNGNAKKLPNGVKTVSELKGELANC